MRYGLGLWLGRSGYVGGEVAPSTPMSVAQAPTFTHDGVTLTFGASGAGARVGKTLNEPWIINDSGFTITSDSPSGVNDANGYAQNGIMLNPYGGMTQYYDTPLPQGFDGLIGSTWPVSPKDGIPYDTAVNVSPTKTGGATLTIAPGWQGVIVKQIRRAGAANGAYDVSDHYVYFNVVTSVPAENSYPLAPSDTVVGTIYGRADLANRNVFKNLTPYTGMVDSATCLSKFPRGIPKMGWSGERYRRMQVLPGYSGYSAQYSAELSDARLFLHSNVSDANTDELFDRCVMVGIHTYGAYKRGYRGTGGGAGQGFNEIDDLYVAGFALGSQAMIDAANDMRSNLTVQMGTVTAPLIGKSTVFPGGVGKGYRYRSPYQTSQIGLPEWSLIGAGITERYRDVCSAPFLAGLPALALLQNGPSGLTGEQALINGGYTPSIDYMDRVNAYNYLPVAARHRQMYADWRPNLSRSTYVCPPEPFDAPSATAAVAGSGQITYNFTAYNYSIGAITRTDVRYSLDGISWTVINNTTASGVITGLMHGAKYYVGVRFWNASGAGLWSYIWPLETAPGQIGGAALLERYVATTTGSTTNTAPTNVTPPSLYYKEYPAFIGPLYEPASGGLPLRELFCGVGNWAGYPAPTYTFQWQRNGADIPGEINQSYLLWGYDAGQDITCIPTASNGVGSPVSITTASVTPAAATGTQAYYIPTGTLNALPAKFTERWAGLPAITLLRKTFGTSPIAELSSNSTVSNRFWSLDDALPIGDLSDVPEGEMYIESISSANVAGTRFGLVIRSTGTLAAGDGYILEAITTPTSLILRVNRVVAGVTTNVSSSPTTVYASVPGFSNGYTQNADKLGFRVQWYMSGASLVINMKAWSLNEGFVTDGEDAPDLEPVAYWHTYTDTAPRPSGRIGVGSTSTPDVKRLYGIGIGVGAGVSAPKVPV